MPGAFTGLQGGQSFGGGRGGGFPLQQLGIGLLGALGGAFGNSGPTAPSFGRLTGNTLDAQRQLFSQLLGQSSGLLADASRQGSAQGIRLGQDVQAALGSVGGGRTGTGTITRSLAGNLASQQSLAARSAIMQSILGASLQGALGIGQQQTALQGQAMSQQQGGGGLGGALGGLGQVLPFLLGGI